MRLNGLISERFEKAAKIYINNSTALLQRAPTFSPGLIFPESIIKWMNAKVLALFLIYLATIAVAGCTSGSQVKDQPAQTTLIKLEASPQRYSLSMSSTPGVRLSVNTTGFTPSEAQFRWSADYGHFFSWNAPDFRINDLGNPVLNNGETIYWGFTENPLSTKDPITVTVVAKDLRSGTVLGTSTVTLRWDGNYTVYVQDIM